MAFGSVTRQHTDVLQLRARYRWLLIGVTLCVAGLAAVLWARHLAFPEAEIVGSLGQALITTALVAWVYEYFSKKDILELLDARLSLTDSFKTAGLLEVADPSNYDQMFAHLESARLVRLLSLDAEKPFSLKRDVIKGFLLRGGTSIECVFVDPDSDMARLVEQERTTSPKSQKQRYELTMQRLEGIVDLVKEEIQSKPPLLRRPSHVVVKKYKALSYCSLMFFDGHLCFYKPYFAHSRGLGTFGYYAKCVPEGLYHVCEAHYEFVERNAELVGEWTL